MTVLFEAPELKLKFSAKVDSVILTTAKFTFMITNLNWNWDNSDFFS